LTGCLTGCRPFRARTTTSPHGRAIGSRSLAIDLRWEGLDRPPKAITALRLAAYRHRRGTAPLAIGARPGRPSAIPLAIGNFLLEGRAKVSRTRCHSPRGWHLVHREMCPERCAWRLPREEREPAHLFVAVHTSSRLPRSVHGAPKSGMPGHPLATRTFRRARVWRIATHGMCRSTPGSLTKRPAECQ